MKKTIYQMNKDNFNDLLEIADGYYGWISTIDYSYDPNDVVIDESIDVKFDNIEEMLKNDK